MSDSLITRCPKCSTAFRVTDDVLSMAKGKVRCGQCFHIFDARNTSLAQPVAAEPPHTNTQQVSATPVEANKDKQTNAYPKPLFTAADEEPSHSEWLNTLFNEEDLAPGTPDDPLFDRPQADNLAPSFADKKTPENHHSRTEKKPHTTGNEPETPSLPNNAQQKNTSSQEPAPWERELAEVEAALSITPKPQPIKKETIENFVINNKTEKVEPESKSEPEPDYMLALHSLTQSASEQSIQNKTNKQHTALNELTGQEYLDPLIGEYETTQTNTDKPKILLWFLGVLFGIFALFIQVTGHFFIEGSNSENFRVFYRTFCTYTGCSLPAFVNIDAISIQHVRIQSHPTKADSLLVNAIMTNTSRYAQPMPKVALEFFDLNGAPVAARLFDPKSYLDKDFLDITYMPPNTPIHLVIPIHDPGARAVTHQLRTFPSGTRSY